jgi:hypothetical protein
MDLHHIIKKQVNNLATTESYQEDKPYCYFDSHQWVNGYGWPSDLRRYVGHNMLKKGAVQFPYQVCKFCQKRRENN